MPNVVIKILNQFEYRIEVSSDVNVETTSFDGFVFASNSQRKAAFSDFNAFGREQLNESQPLEIINALYKLLTSRDLQEKM
jgi:hypothetical protein